MVRGCFARPDATPTAGLPVVLVDPTDYAKALDCVRAAASDADRDPMSITPGAVRTVVTGRSRDDVDEALTSVVLKSAMLGVPGRLGPDTAPNIHWAQTSPACKT